MITNRLYKPLDISILSKSCYAFVKFKEGMSILKKAAIFLFSALLIFSFNLPATKASTGKVMWGKTVLKKGQIGKVTILKDTYYF